ncbi:hypothetical protein GTP44_03765 [Duganella sp. FT50W]|uniref:Glycine-rich domain-containing protein n=1 Tax=Duganella lactea TaxID=2692173 RepID=A0A6L8MDT9_9BURK|nr:hypothetical protein [Duganella lactea]MYM81077.1 hypothetical protein [Duganella lactea]
MAITAPVHADALPVAPSIDRPDDFDPEADAFAAAQGPFGIQMNALGDNVYANALAVQTLAAATDSNAQAAATSATQASGHRAAAQQAASDAGGYALASSNSATAAASSATAAQNSATAAAVAATSLTATSATSIAAGTGDKVFVIGGGKQFPEGEVVAITSKGAPGIRMFGTVKSYVGTALTVMVDGVEGAGTRADWVIGPGGQQGKQGIQGLTGGVNGGSLTGQLVERKAANITAAATINIWAADGNSATLVGATAVVSLGESPQPGAKFTLIAAAATPLINGANLVLPGGVDYTTTVGDRLEIFAETSTKMDVSIFKADGAPVIGGATYVTRTANVMLTRSDTGKFIDITSGTFTQTFDNLANLPASWSVWIRNSGSGDITIPASDDRTNWIMYTGETRLFMKDQVSLTLKSIVEVSFQKTIVTSGSFRTPPGYTSLTLELWGGGGSGAATAYASAAFATGGTGGSYILTTIPVADILSVSPDVTTTVGAGGLAVGASGSQLSNGNQGGSTTFGTYATANGGVGGTALAGSTNFATALSTASSPFGAQLTISGGIASYSGTNNPVPGGDTHKSGAGGGSAGGPATTQYTSYGGTSIYGGKGGDANLPGSAGVPMASNQASQAGVEPGGGGGGCKANSGFVSTSGAGARGRIIVRGNI